MLLRSVVVIRIEDSQPQQGGSYYDVLMVRDDWTSLRHLWTATDLPSERSAFLEMAVQINDSGALLATAFQRELIRVFLCLA